MGRRRGIEPVGVAASQHPHGVHQTKQEHAHGTLRRDGLMADERSPFLTYTQTDMLPWMHVIGQAKSAL